MFFYLVYFHMRRYFGVQKNANSAQSDHLPLLLFNTRCTSRSTTDGSFFSGVHLLISKIKKQKTKKKTKSETSLRLSIGVFTKYLNTYCETFRTAYYKQIHVFEEINEQEVPLFVDVEYKSGKKKCFSISSASLEQSESVPIITSYFFSTFK